VKAFYDADAAVADHHSRVGQPALTAWEARGKPRDGSSTHRQIENALQEDDRLCEISVHTLAVLRSYPVRSVAELAQKAEALHQIDLLDDIDGVKAILADLHRLAAQGA
jgi:hypothetical protein